MKTDEIEKLVSTLFNNIRSFVFAHTQKQTPSVEDKLDALLMEKAVQEGVDIKLKKPTNWVGLAAIFFGTSVFAVAVSLVVLFVPGPWTRLFAKPQIVSMALSNVDFTFNGVSSASKEITINSPKAVRGVQYVQSNLVVEPQVPVSITLADDSKKIVIVPKTELAKGTAYKVTLKPGVLFDDGTYLANEQSWVIPTKAIFDVVSLSPRDGVQAPRNTTLEVSFSTDEFELSEAVKNITIFPSLDGNYKKDGASVIFVPSKQLQSGGVYTLKVAKTMKSTDGTEISKDYQSTFSVVKVIEGKTLPAALSFEKTAVNISASPMMARVTGTNVKKISAATFAVNWDAVKPYVDDYIAKGIFNPEPLVATLKAATTATYNGGKMEGTQYYNYDIDLSKLQNGIYVVKVSDTSNAQTRQYAIVFKSNLGVYSVNKASGNGADVWVFNYKTLSPEKDVDVIAVTCDEKGNCPSVTQATPENGYVQTKADQTISYLVARKGSAAVILYPGIRSDRIYGGYSDTYDNGLLAKVIINKPVFTPGSVAKYSVILRQKKDGEYKNLPEGQKFTIAICPYNYDGYAYDSKPTELSTRCISVKELTTSSASQIEDATVLWNRKEDLNLLVVQKVNGKEVVVASENLLVQEVDKPQVSVSVETDKAHYVGDTPIKITGRVTNYVDAGLQGKTVVLYVSYSGAGTSFTDEKSAITDADGNYAITIPVPVERASIYSYDVAVSAHVADGDNTIAHATQVVWDRGDTVAVKVTNDGKETTSVPVGKKPQVTLNFTDTTTLKSIPNKKVKLTVSRNYSVQVVGTTPVYDEYTHTTYIPTYYESHTEDVLTRDATSDSNGKVTIEVPETKEGQYYVTINDQESGRKWIVNEGNFLFYVSASSYDDYDKVNEWVNGVSFDRDLANVGDRAVITINTSFKKTKEKLALLVKTAEVIEWRYIDQSTSSIDFPITKAMVGGVEVCIVHPMHVYTPRMNAASGKYIGDGLVNICDSLLVENKDQKLTINTTPAAKEVAPGKESDLAIEVKDSQGKGVRSVVGISVADKSLYLLDGNTDPSIYYTDLYNEIYKSFSTRSDRGTLSSDVYDLLDFYGGMGGAGDMRETVRKNFDDNPFWKAQLSTDNAGKITVPVQYSDAITSWVVTVWAVTDDLKVATTNFEIISKKDVYIDFDRPSVIRKGDKWLPYVRVTNSTAQSFSGTMEISCDGCLDTPVTYPVALKAKETVDQQIALTMKKEGSVPISLKLTQNGKTIDEMQYTIEVKPIGFEVPFQQTTTITKDNNQVKLSLSDKTSPQLSTFNLILSQMPLVSGNRLRIDPAYATTPELAGALAAVGTLAEENAFGTAFDTKEDLLQRAQFYVTELIARMQPNGSFSFDTYTGTNYDASVQAAYALAIAHKGFGTALSIDEKIIATAVDYQKSLILSDKVAMPIKAEAAYALALLQKDAAAPLVTALYKVTDTNKATLDQLSYTALALNEIGATADAGTLVQYLDGKAISSDGLVYIPATSRDVATSSQAFLINKLGLQSAYKDRMKALQSWVLNSCAQCGTLVDEAIATRLLTQSLLSEQQGSAKAETVTVSINGEKIAEPFYDGVRLNLALPEAKFKQGDNTIEVKTASGKLLFASLEGTYYQTQSEERNSSSYTVSTTIHGLDGNRRISVGSANYLETTITAATDTLPSVVKIYLPTGLRGKYWLDDNNASGVAFNNLLKDGKALLAYGDSTRSDAYAVSIPALKKGQKVIVVLPYIAVRQGTFSGEIIQVTNAGDATSGALVYGKAVEVR